ncbi:glycerate kinase type-2 family protein [Bradyrhizobium genosp. P]|uniref:glycerate kinase type-2 family protein n=1 Tax=Bradyrhizobium genosp. P TaxID=83641 RepID=UPI003CF31ED5
MIPGYVPSAIERLRAEAVALFREGVAAADPRRAVSAALDRYSDSIDRADRVIVLALGKAAVPMAAAALPFARGKLGQAIALTNHENAVQHPGLVVIGAGHPIPDHDGLAGALAIERAAMAAREGDLVLVLVSGGGSSLLCAPWPGITLEDKIKLHKALICCGADITEINAVRPIFSRLKGGGLAMRARPAQVLGLILSDVPDDDMAKIASGPTVAARVAPEQAHCVLEKYGLLDELPQIMESYLRGAIDGRHDANAFDHVDNILVGSNRLSLQAVMARARETCGTVVLGCDWLAGDVNKAAIKLHTMASAAAASNRPIALICGGETTVEVKGPGKGGRNQELAMRFARLNEQQPIPRDWVFLSAGTDGRDGPCDAAGAIVDAGSLSWMRHQGCDPDRHLADNDAYPALACSGDLLLTGATGTNVADIQIILVQ